MDDGLDDFDDAFVLTHKSGSPVGTAIFEEETLVAVEIDRPYVKKFLSGRISGLSANSQHI